MAYNNCATAPPFVYKNKEDALSKGTNPQNSRSISFPGVFIKPVLGNPPIQEIQAACSSRNSFLPQTKHQRGKKNSFKSIQISICFYLLHIAQHLIHGKSSAHGKAYQLHTLFIRCLCFYTTHLLMQHFFQYPSILIFVDFL